MCLLSGWKRKLFAIAAAATIWRTSLKYRYEGEFHKEVAVKQASPGAVVTGVGPGTGAAIARRFAHGEYAVAMLARTHERLVTRRP